MFPCVLLLKKTSTVAMVPCGIPPWYASVVVAAGAAAWFYNIDILMWQSAKIHTADTRVHTYMVWVTKEARDGVLVVATAVGWHKEKSMNSMLI